MMSSVIIVVIHEVQQGHLSFDPTFLSPVPLPLLLSLFLHLQHRLQMGVVGVAERCTKLYLLYLTLTYTNTLLKRLYRDDVIVGHTHLLVI